VKQRFRDAFYTDTPEWKAGLERKAQPHVAAQAGRQAADDAFGAHMAIADLVTQQLAACCRPVRLRKPPSLPASCSGSCPAANPSRWRGRPAPSPQGHGAARLPG
jgi:hypothetical protein